MPSTMRRTTLGPMTGSQLNSRASLGGRPSLGAARVGMMSKRPSRGKVRHSVQPTPDARHQRNLSAGRQSSVNGQRRSSVYGGSSRAADPRPLGDRSFINACIRNLIQYLSENQYDHALSPKLLTRPTKKDFHNIVQFLVRRADPNYLFGEKLEEEVISVFRSFRYPFGISKTALVAVGSPHTWPALLASITWLIELLSYAEEAEEQDNNRDYLEGDGSEKLFFDYLGQAYRSFLSGDDDHYAALEDELRQSFDSKNEDVTAQVERFKKENAALRREIEDLKTTQSALPDLQLQKKDYESDLQKFKTLISQLENHKASLLRKIEDREEDLASKQAEKKKYDEEIRTLQDRIETQELSASDVQRITQEKNCLQEQVAAISTYKTEVQESVWDMEMKMAAKLEELEKEVYRYNTAAAKMQLIPTTAKYANGNDYEAKINPKSAPGSGQRLLSLDFKSNIKGAIVSLKESVIKRTHLAQDEVLELQNDLENHKETARELENEVRAIEHKCKRVEETYKMEREALEASVAAKVSEAEEVEYKIQQLNNGKELDYVLSQNTEELQRLKTRIQEEKQFFEQEKERLRNRMTDMLFALTDHKGYIESQLKGLEAYCETKLENIRSNERDQFSIAA